MSKLISLDEIMSKRQFSVKTGPKGDMLTKVYKAPASWNAEARSAKFVMTAQIKDRYGDIVVSKGGDLADFVNNPVCLWAHNAREAPIGMWSDIALKNGTPKRLEGLTNLSPEGTTEQGDTVARLLAANMVRACSIGFIPKEWESIDKEQPWMGYQFNEWEMLECSICSVPANPAALVKAAGGDDRAALQAIELVLDEWAMTPAGAIVPRSIYERAYTVEKNDATVTVVEVRSFEEPVETPPVIDIAAEVDKALAKREDTFLERIGKLFNLKAAEPEKPVVETPIVEAPVDPAADVARRRDAVINKSVEPAAEEIEALAASQAELELRMRATLALADA